MSRKTALWTFTGLVLFNLGIRLLWLWFMHPSQVDDFAWYFSHAKQMYEGEGYVWYGHYTSYWPIGYPFFLSVLFHLTGPSVTAGLIVNILLSTGIVLLVYVIAKQILASPSAALCAALGYTLLPSQIAWNSVLGSEELFTFLLLSSIAVLVLWGSEGRRNFIRVACAGLLIGLAADVRPIVIIFPVFLLAYFYWFEKQRLRTAVFAAILFGVTMVIGISPVTIRNYAAIHHFILVSTNGGVNLWQGTHANGSYFWSWNPKVNPLLPYVKNDYVENQVGMHAAIQFYLHHPIRGVLNGFAKIFFLYWVDWNVVSVTFQESARAFSAGTIKAAMWFMTVVYWVWMGIMVFGLIRVRRTQATGGVQRPAVWLPLVYIVYNTAIFFVFPAWDRFRYPMMPLFAVYFGLGLRVLISKIGWRTRV